MRSISIDFAPRRMLPRWASASVLAVLVGVVSSELYVVIEFARELQALRAQVAQANARAIQARDEQKQREQRALQQSQTPEARMLAAIAGFPLDEVLANIEQAHMDGIRLMMVDISAADAAVRIECDYSKVDRVLEYSAKLQEFGKQMRWQITQLRSTARDNSGAGSAVLVGKLVANIPIEGKGSRPMPPASS